MKKTVLLLVVLLPGLSLSASALQRNEGQSREDTEALRQEQQEDYYQKWLEEDVVYVISPEEKKVFESLTTPEEKEQFIEQFWYRRDEDPRTAINEFKEEHYRRIAYANERFASGIPGWMTDRGRIYITHGKPDEIESHPSGGSYLRPDHEGGGTTATFPFEKWWYRHIPGIGSDIELEFVDPSFSGEYRLALRPEEKDALLHVPGAGLTWAEEMGLVEKKDRPYFNPGARDYPYMFQRAKDNPFQRYETYAMVQRPPEIKYKDLKELVEVNISYNTLPFKTRRDYFQLNESQVLVPITLEFQNKDLTFKEENGVHNAKLAIYGVITSITNRLVNEFEDDVITSYQPDRLQKGLTARSMYQKVVPLDRRMRYKLDLIVKDLNSGHVGVTRLAIVPPAYQEEKMTASSLLLADMIHELPEIPTADEMFVIGDVKVRPSISKEFPVNHPLGVYFQIYNVGIDQTSMTPALTVKYELVNKEGETILEMADERGESVQYFSGQRVVLIRAIPTENLEPGDYRLAVEIRDRIKDQVVSVRDDFRLTAPIQMASSR